MDDSEQIRRDVERLSTPGKPRGLLADHCLALLDERDALKRQRDNFERIARDLAKTKHKLWLWRNENEPRLQALIDALTEIQKKQPEMVEIYRKHGIVFDGPLGTDPKNWQHVAFSTYTQLCEVESIARSALDVDAV